MARYLTRVALAGLLGSIASFVVTASCLAARSLTAWGPDLDVAATLAATVAGALLAVAFQVRSLRTRQRLLEEVERHLAVLREDPGPNAGAMRRVLAGPELAGVRDQAAALAACYRKALADVVTVRERLDKLKAVLGQVEAGDHVSAVTPTHLVVGTSRHRMVARIAPNLSIIAVTAPLRLFLYRTSQQLLSRSFLDVVHPDDAPTVRQALRESLRDGEGHNITFRILLPTSGQGLPADRLGLERHLQMDVLTCYDETGAPLNLRCHFVDITDRVLTERELLRRTREVSEANDRLRQANADLERLKDSYRDLYHHAPVLYFSLDAAGNFVVFNETMLRELGYPREALLGKSYATLLTPAGRAAFRADPTLIKRPEQETQWVKQDGTVIDVWIGTTIRDDGSALSRCVARDITETKRLANAYRLKASELVRANSHLRRINQELEEFTYVVSHDLKEPLRTLESFSNFLALDYGDKLEGEGKEFITHLVQASKRLGRLIDDLLKLSRTGRVINTPRPFTWEPVVDTVLRDLHELIGRKGAMIRIEEPLPSAMGDPERVIQLLVNLVSNGLKYSQGPRPEVVIGSRGPSENGDGRGFVTLFVRDNGIGIDPAYHEQVFRIFRRLHHREDVEGTGAGLAICKRIVEAHGGRIWIESQVGQGATFLFTLPAQPAEGRFEVSRGKPVLAAG